MKYYDDGNKTIVEGYDSFHIQEILECGQCFRFEKISNDAYDIMAHRKKITVTQQQDHIVFESVTKQEFETIWMHYFDFDTDYRQVKATLWEKDLVIRDAIEYAPGIRILNQDPWECLLSFIISQNNRIPRIKQIIQNISEKYGDNGTCFPTPMQMAGLCEEELKLCKTGFRAAYMIDAAQKVSTSALDLNGLNALETTEARKQLMTVKGIGPKVSDCILLFAFGRREVFPTDVWVKRVMEHFYFHGNETSIEHIHELAYKKFGEQAGIAQQYLFHYARCNAIL